MNWFIFQLVNDIPDDHVMPVGLPNMYTVLKIVNRQTNQPVGGAEEQGEICVKSPQNFIGYLGSQENKTVTIRGLIHRFYRSKLIDKGIFWNQAVQPILIQKRKNFLSMDCFLRFG